MRKVKAVDYRRSATNDEQQLKEQNAMAMKYCEEKGYELVGSYSDVSGTTTNRHEFKKMMADAKDNKFNMIITIDESRISRNVVEFLQFIQELEKYNCKFETVNGSNGSYGDWTNKLSASQLERLMNNESATPAETVLASVIKGMSEYDSRMRSSRIKNGLAEARANGVVLGRPPKKVQ